MAENAVRSLLFSIIGFLIFGFVTGLAAARAAARKGRTGAQRIEAFFLGFLLGGLAGFGAFLLAMYKIVS